MKLIIICVCLLYMSIHVLGAGLKEEFTWSRISFVWPRESRYGFVGGGDEATDSGTTGETIAFPDGNMDMGGPANNDDQYIYRNNIPMSANRWGNKLFVSVPRRRAGVPSTLNFVWMNSTERHNVPLIPYPDFETNQLHPASGQPNLVSVYRTAVDPCDRLWTIDTGLIEIPGNNTRFRPPTIIIIDLHTDQIIKQFTLPPEVISSNPGLASLTIDVTSSTCDDAFVYIPDLSGYRLIVYSLKENDAWHVQHNYFFLEPQAGEFFIGGVNFQWNDGIFSVALSDIQSDGFRTAYFHSMAGTHMYSVSTKILRDRALATRSYHGNDFKVLGDRRAGSQTASADLHQSSGVMFLGLVNENALGCWNTRKPFKQENFGIVQKDNQKMIYPCDVKVSGNDVIVLTNTMPVFLYSNLDYTQTNFRVWISNVADAVKGTPCDGGRGSTSRPGRPSRPGGYGG